MLTLTVLPGEYIQIGDDIKVCVQKGRTGKLRLAIDAPKDVLILRDKVIERNEINELFGDMNETETAI